MLRFVPLHPTYQMIARFRRTPFYQGLLSGKEWNLVEFMVRLRSIASNTVICPLSLWSKEEEQRSPTIPLSFMYYMKLYNVYVSG